MKKYNIIVADDVPDMRMLIIEMIDPICQNCYEAENGAEVIKLMIDNDDIDVILTDIEMPKLNGLDATEQIRKKFTKPKSNIPIIAITAYNSFPFAERCKKAGINQVLSKPFSDSEIIDAILGLCEK